MTKINKHKISNNKMNNDPSLAKDHSQEIQNKRELFDTVKIAYTCIRIMRENQKVFG